MLARGREAVSRQAHNLKIAGANPAPATLRLRGAKAKCPELVEGPSLRFAQCKLFYAPFASLRTPCPLACVGFGEKKIFCVKKVKK
jgi:hypothetical protein